MRLDAQLAKLFPNYSRSQLQQFIADGRVTVNGKVIAKSSFPVSDDDLAMLNEPISPDFSRELSEFKKHVVYIDDNVVVINKPAGVLVHAKGGTGCEFTVADYVKSVFDVDELTQNMNNNRLGIIHRLDRATSGIIICARNLKTASMLSRQFAERKAKKTYLAVVSKEPKELSATINLPIGRNLSKPSTFKVSPSGKVAITDYDVLETRRDGFTLVELKPHTGRTHQLRVHMSYIGSPIVGDPIYGTGKFGDRLMLHAWKLEISIPGANGNVRKTFIADPPKEFTFNGK